MAELSPTSRALLALELLQDHPGITAERLAAKLGVSERAVRRYVGILREAGITIESVRGPYGGYRVGRGLRLPPLTFTAAEALGLVMAVLDGHHVANDATDVVGSALGKITRALPAPVAAQADAVRRTTAAAPDRSAIRPDPAVVTAVVSACSQAQRLRLEYRSDAGKEWELDIDPWAVVVRHGRWYLLGHAVRADARRVYRLDRVRSLRPTEPAAVLPPPDLDPVRVLEEHLALGWEYEVEVLIDAPFDQVWHRVPRTIGRLEPVDDTHCRLTGSTSSTYWYAQQLAGIPAPYRIVRGDEVRRAARNIAANLAAAAEPSDAEGQLDR